MSHPEEEGEGGFNIYSLTITLLLSVFLAIISTYIALKISALPWPIVFSVVVSMALIKAIKKHKGTTHEINVAQAGGTIGGLIAAGIVFVIPAIIVINNVQGTNMPIPSFLDLSILAIFGGLLGVSLSMPIRRVLIDEENLPYPSGLAGAEIIKSGDEGGIRAIVLVDAAIIAAIYAVLSSLQLPPILTATVVIAGFILIISIYPIMLAFGSGYILGPTGAVISWFLGALIGWGIIIPYASKYNPLGLTGNLELLTASYTVLVQEIGIGLVLGGGFAFLVFYAIPGAGKVFKPFMKISGEEPWYMKIQIPLTLLAMIALIFIGIHPINAILGVVGAWFMATVAGKMTGETNIDPLEQFGLFIGLLVLFFSSVLGISGSLYQAILVTSFVAIASAVAGDIGHDFKGAQYLGTKPIDIVKADLSAVIVGGIVAPLSFLFLYDLNKGNFFDVFSAVQSKVVAGAIGGLTYPNFFALGFILGVLVELFNRIMIAKRGSGTILNGMTLGIGFFLGWLLAIPFAVGALIRWFVDKKYPSYSELGFIAAAGIMAGEGFMFYLVNLFALYGVSYSIFALLTVALTLPILIITVTGKINLSGYLTWLAILGVLSIIAWYISIRALTIMAFIVIVSSLLYPLLKKEK
ncbi:MAG: OPT/YSL family transporter [Candidatus Njordarchaeia archaeon]